MPRAQDGSATDGGAAPLAGADLAETGMHAARMVRVPRPDGASEDEGAQAPEACVVTVAGNNEKDCVGKCAELLATPVAAALGAFDLNTPLLHPFIYPLTESCSCPLRWCVTARPRLHATRDGPTCGSSCMHPKTQPPRRCWGKHSAPHGRLPLATEHH